MLFFANLKTADLTAISIRGLCISYVGFLALRSVDFYKAGLWLDRHLDLGLSKSLPMAMNVLAASAPEQTQKPEKKPGDEGTGA